MSYEGVAVDVDGVLADFAGAAVQYARVLTGREIPYGSLTEYDLSKLWPEIKEEMRAHWRSRGFCALLQLVAGSKCSFKTLERIFGRDKIRFVTTPMPNSEFWIPERTAWLKSHFGASPNDIIYTDDKTVDTKSKYLIDDRPENCEAWAKTGRPALLVWQPFNGAYQVPFELVKLITRVADFEEAVEEIEILEGEKC